MLWYNNLLSLHVKYICYLFYVSAFVIILPGDCTVEILVIIITVINEALQFHLQPYWITHRVTLLLCSRLQSREQCFIGLLIGCT